LSNSLLIATGNPGKIREIEAILSSLKVRLISDIKLSQSLQVKEMGKTYAQNARIKAEAYLKATGIPSLADDSGLEVDALDGAPGIYSARFSPLKDATDADRRAYLRDQLQNIPQPWTARFHCAAILALPNGEIIETAGQCEGVIIAEERGLGGFGYDRMFLLPEYGSTMAELPEDVKNRISHRAKALLAMMPYLSEYLG
jgi:XTP/dITP diphosphohydrolase